jgi:hypothetical protein
MKSKMSRKKKEKIEGGRRCTCAQALGNGNIGSHFDAEALGNRNVKLRFAKACRRELDELRPLLRACVQLEGSPPRR